MGCPESHCLEKQQSMTSLHIGNYKIFMREIKGDQNNWEIYIVDGTEDSILSRCQFSMNYAINSIQLNSDFQETSYGNWQVDSKIHMEVQRIQNI